MRSLDAAPAPALPCPGRSLLLMPLPGNPDALAIPVLSSTASVPAEFQLGCWKQGQDEAGERTQIVNEEKNAVRQEFNFEKARLEVHKFGITGYKKQEQRAWERERAIMLGAKPPKKACVNYRTYQEKLKEKKAAKDANKEKEHKGDSLKKKKKQKEQKERKAKRKKSVPSIWPAGQVGKFRNGTLILQSRDIKKIKSSKVSK
ncbi:uncharacterized protein C1orf131 homolog [Cyanistes caeruleus]|uniref:uncharacterized protein C1orf131 homolog n=1 Tax=Cyanistes caeruleus TaxID=156563 RepID=UPI000CDB5B75|nr:uncharacterized protein C1orf131 homolog [Cyanistes caeruleus]